MTVAWTPPLLDAGLEGAQAWNAVVALAGEPIPLGETGATVTLTLSSPPAADAWAAAVGLDGGPQPLLAHVRSFPFRALFQVELGVEDIAGLPEGLRQALLEGMFEFVRALLPADQAGRLRIGEQGVVSGFPAFARPGVQWFAARLVRPDGHAIELDLACERAVAARLLAGIDPAASPMQAAVAQKVTTPVDVTIGAITVAGRELALLEPGAVVVMAEMPAGTVRLRAGALSFDFARTEEGWRCAGPRPAERRRSPATPHGIGEEQPMDEDNRPAEAAEPATVADLRIAIDFDVGRSMVPLSALSQWRDGTVVELDPPQLGEGVEVTIRANGDVVGSGDIVRIDDRIAVRITRFMLRT